MEITIVEVKPQENKEECYWKREITACVAKP